MLLILAAGTQVARAQTDTPISPQSRSANSSVQGTATPVGVPTVSIPRQPVRVPTVTIPRPHHPRRAAPRRVARIRKPPYQWITAYLTSYCPGSAGWLSSSGRPVFYGMLANDYYPFGTRIWMPVLGMTGVVEDRMGAFDMWNHFDVWSPTCYGTPTGWYRVGVVN